MAWKTVDLQEQRVRFVVMATEKSQSFSSLCAAYGISRPTGYLWLRRYRESGIAGIAEQSRKPHGSPRRTAASGTRVADAAALSGLGCPEVAGVVVARRRGAAAQHDPSHSVAPRPGAAGRPTIPALQRFERERPNELWQMDFKGPRGWPQPVGPLSVLDDHSRYLIALAANGSTQGEPVRQQLEEAFQRCGVPEAMLMDHGSPWWGHLAPSGHTRLSLWLMRQGIRLHWSRIRHPQTQGKVERFHGSLQRALERRGFPQQPRKPGLIDYRWEHNYVRPHEALGMKTPATVWSPSRRRYDPHPPRWEYPWMPRFARWTVREAECRVEIGTSTKHWRASGCRWCHRRTLDGLLLHHPGPRNRPRNPALDDRRALDP